MKLIDADHKQDQEFQASLHGARLSGSTVGGIGGKRRSFIDRLKAKGR